MTGYPLFGGWLRAGQEILGAYGGDILDRRGKVGNGGVRSRILPWGKGGTGGGSEGC